MVQTRPQILNSIIYKVYSCAPKERYLQWKTLKYIQDDLGGPCRHADFNFSNTNYKNVVDSLTERWLAKKKELISRNSDRRYPQSLEQIHKEIDERCIWHFFQLVYVAVQFGYVDYATSLLQSDIARNNELIMRAMFEHKKMAFDTLYADEIKEIVTFVCLYYNRINHPFIENLKNCFYSKKDEDNQLKEFTNVFGTDVEKKYLPYYFGEKRVEVMTYRYYDVYNVNVPDTTYWKGRFEFARSLLENIGSELILI